MNHLTPLSIRRQEFKKNLRGYDSDEVNAFLEIVANSYEDLLKKNEDLNYQLATLNKKIQDYHQIEKGLQQTLLNAQETTHKSIETSKRQANLIVKEAEIKAKEIVESAKNDAKLIIESVSELRTEKETLVDRIKAIVNAQMQLLDTLTHDDDSEKKLLNDKIKMEKIIERLI